MREKFTHVQNRQKTVLFIFIIILALASVTPVLAEYIGPQRTVTQTINVCKVYLRECKYVAAKDEYQYKKTDSWSCANESKPWLAYSEEESPWGCSAMTVGDTYWSQEELPRAVTTTYPAATIDGSLQNCTLNNGWCTTAPQLALSGYEPVTGQSITALEGYLNGQYFACPGASCTVPLIEGDNNFTYWALSSFGDSSTMGSLAAKVDSQLPTITGLLTGTLGSNGWYISPISFNGSASDTTSGLASFTCTLDGVALGSCSSISINGEGIHTLVLTASDNAGNMRSLTRNPSIDTRAPILNASLSGTTGSNNWYTSATLSATASDPTPGSGLSTFRYKLDGSNWITFPSSGVLTLPEGTHTVDIQAVDNAGRTISTSKAFSLDSGKPIVTVDSTGTLGSNNWYITSPNVSASASDDISGLDGLEYSLDSDSWTTYTAPLDISEGVHSISFWAQDKAGLVKQVDRSYQVDTRAPQIGGGVEGIEGLDGWYTSEVTVSASVSDPNPGSGMDTFTYILDGSAATSYTDPLTLSDGQHTIEFNAQDQAGLRYTVEQNIKVDTLPPSLTLSNIPPTWSKGNITFSGTASDDGSGLSNVEISTDDGTTWQTLSDAASWNYAWNTQESLDGSYPVRIRAIDQAGLTTEKTLNAGLDNHAPTITLPNSWFQWDTVALDIRDEYSGVSTARLEISDPQGRWPARVIELDPHEFPLSFKWDRRLGDGTIAPAESYTVQVTAVDNLGNTAYQSASINVLIEILPPGPTATPQVFSSREPTTTFTPAYTATATTASLPTATPTTVVHVFGGIQPTSQVIATATIPTISPTPRTAPTQNTVSNWLESLLAPTPESTKQTAELVSFEPEPADSKPTNSGSNVLWGATAAAMVGAATAYAAEERRKQHDALTAEEEARRKQHEEKMERDAIKAQEKELRHATVTQHMQKLDAQRAQEAAWEAARLQQKTPDITYEDVMDAKMARTEWQQDVAWMASQQIIHQRMEEKKKEEELKAGLAAYYNAAKQGNTVLDQPKQKTWWERSVDWIDQHQTEIALGLGIAIGVGVVIISGGIASPLLAVALTLSSAAVAAGATAVGTVALNKHYGRPWNENVLKNLTVAGLGAAVVTGAWFTFQIGSTGLGIFCRENAASCARAEPIFNAIDMGEELWLNGKAAYQKWIGDPAYQDTLLELQMEHMDGGMPGNSVAKELGGETLEAVAKYGDDAIELAGQYGDDAVRIIFEYGQDGISLLQKHGTDAIELISTYGDDGVALLLKYGDNAVSLVKDHGIQAIKVLKAIDSEAAKTLFETLDDDVLEYATQQGDDALAALARWSKDDLSEHGIELALRAKKDAQALADVKKLMALGPLDPKNLTAEQKTLIEAIAKNSTQYADNGQIVLGKWVDYGSGFIEDARNTGSKFYGPHPDIWNNLGELGEQGQSETAWLINQQVIRNGIDDGLPFEFSLNGLPAKNLENEDAAIEAIFSGKTDMEILDALDVKVMPVRMKELQELQKAGYEFTFDITTKSYIFAPP